MSKGPAMDIHFTCENPKCVKSLHAPQAAAGKKARCPHCGTVQAVPAWQGPADIGLTEPDLGDLTTTSLLSQMNIKSIVPPAAPKVVVPSKRPYAIIAIAAVGVLALTAAVLALAMNKSDKSGNKNTPVAKAPSDNDANASTEAPGAPSFVANPQAAMTEAQNTADRLVAPTRPAVSATPGPMAAAGAPAAAHIHATPATPATPAAQVALAEKTPPSDAPLSPDPCAAPR